MKRLFIVGCPRSGTTLLQSMIAAHPNMISYTESHFFSKGFSNVIHNFYKPKKHITELVRSFFDENHFDPKLIEKHINLLKEAKNANECAKIFTQALDEHSKRKGADGWIEKTPAHLHHIRFISKCVDDAYFIHIVRDGKYVVSSIYNVSNSYPEIWGARSIENCVERWNQDIKTSMKWIKRNNHTGIVFNQLVEKPEECLKYLCDNIGLEWNAGMLDFQSATNNIVSDEEKWKEDNSKSLSKKNRYDLLSEKEKGYVFENINNSYYKAFCNNFEKQNKYL